MFSWSYSLASSNTAGAGTPGSPGQVPGPSDPDVLEIAELALDENGDLEIPIRVLKGAPAVAQRIAVRFRWFLGEWFLDQRQGVPYFRDILIKAADPIVISYVFRQVLVTTPGVKSVISFSATLDPQTRKLSASFEAKLVDGSILTADSAAFIIGS